MVYIFVSNYIPSSWLFSLNGFQFIFLLRDSENDGENRNFLVGWWEEEEGGIKILTAVVNFCYH